MGTQMKGFCKICVCQFKVPRIQVNNLSAYNFRSANLNENSLAELNSISKVWEWKYKVEKEVLMKQTY